MYSKSCGNLSHPTNRQEKYRALTRDRRPVLAGLPENVALLADCFSSGSSLRSMLPRDSGTADHCDLKRIVDAELSMSFV